MVRYYDLAIAEGVTTAGQLSIRWIEKKLNIYLNVLLKTDDEDYVIASDTDSVYICFDKLIQKIFGDDPPIDKVCYFSRHSCTKKKLNHILTSVIKNLNNI